MRVGARWKSAVLEMLKLKQSHEAYMHPDAPHRAIWKHTHISSRPGVNWKTEAINMIACSRHIVSAGSGLTGSCSVAYSNRQAQH